MADINRQLTSSQTEFVNITDFILVCLSKWYWFVISVIICMGIASFHILSTPKIYSRYATILIKETGIRRSANDLESMLSVNGLSQNSSKLANEIIAFQSPDLMREVVRRLNLDYSYAMPGRFKEYALYGTTLPVKAVLLDFPNRASFELKPQSDSTFLLSNLVFVRNAEEHKHKEVYSGHVGDTLDTEIGRIVIQPAAAFARFKNTPVIVRHSGIGTATAAFNRRLTAKAVDMKNYSDVLNLIISDESTQRAEDVLNTVISVYNENWVEDRNKVAISTSNFIQDRLTAIERELGSVDSDISSFKSRNVIPDVAAVSNIYLSQTAENTRAIQNLDNQLYAVKYVRTYLSSNTEPGQLIPAPASLNNSPVSAEIARYNDLLLERNNLAASSSERNPLVIDLDVSLTSMRNSILNSIDTQINTLQAQISNLQRTEQKVTSRLADNPNQEKFLLSVGRQQKVKESLYLYLLQKREENELSQAFTAYNTRTITTPTGSSAPASPQANRIFLVALVLGLFFPLVLIYLHETFNTKIRGRKDLENLPIPFLGEIPQYYVPGQRRPWFPWKKPVSINSIVVEHAKRDTVNEAFRVLRTNLEFISKGEWHQIIDITSFNPGSGKTFTAINLAVALSIKHLKVLVVDADLRRSSLSAYVNSPKVGLTDYLINSVSDIQSVIVHPEGHPELDVIPVGTVPPNPTELIGDEQFAELLKELRDQYDFILVDCPPIDIVADTQIISEIADRTVFLIRSGLMERSMLKELNEIYEQERFKNMAMVLNGTIEGSTLSRSRYGYGYGYGSYYGYGYGYGEKKK
ncbi:MAG: polysaccharide biosynthesis tyrosine autokinase [Bacteroidales bacterium]|nr:polysaccharide biosynthesis tyrosine autokinase [Bacteroidales bacterium]